MSQIKCPHCFTVSEHGVNVCTGCHAEVKYGLGIGSVIISAILSFIASLYTGKMLASLSFFSWLNIKSINPLWIIGGFSLFYFIILIGLFAKLFKNSIVFQRIRKS